MSDRWRGSTGATRAGRNALQRRDKSAPARHFPWASRHRHGRVRAMSDAASALGRLRAELAATKAELARSEAVVSASEAMIAGLKLEIALLRREKYGRSAERTARLIDQLELQLDELETAAAEDAIRAETAAEKTTTVRGFDRRKPVRKPFPAHLPRERVVVEAPTGCSCCGSPRLVKMGEDLTETLEVVPRKWKVIQTVREKFTCRDCEKIIQPPAPFHPIPRGWAGPSLLAMIVFESEPLCAIDGVDGSRSRHRNVPHWVLSKSPMKGAIREPSYHDRHRSGQIRLSAAWCRR